MLSIAGLVTCPINVLKAKETIAPMETPLDLVLVSKISAGIIHDKDPHVNENDIWYTQFVAIKAQPKEC